MAKKHKEAWVSTEQAEIELNLSRWTLYRARDKGIFIKGVHYRNTSLGMRPTYKWNVKEINQLIKDKYGS
jgi:hypothetical protein